MKSVDKWLDQIDKKKLVLVFPHPDDETVWCAGLIQRAIKKDWEVKVVCLTQGERGQVHVKPNGKNLSQIRQEEMKRAMEILGAEFEMHDFGDGRLKETRGWKKFLAKTLETEESGVVVTYDLSGLSGHPDHIAVAAECLKLTRTDRNWRLVWVTVEGRIREYVNKKSESAKYLTKPNLELRLSVWEWIQKHRALAAHRSQPLGSVKRLFVTYRKEHFLAANVNRKYKYKYVDFKI